MLVQDFGKAGEALAEQVVGGQGISMGGGRGGPIQAKVPRGSRLHQIVEWLSGGEGDPLIVGFPTSHLGSLYTQSSHLMPRCSSMKERYSWPASSIRVSPVGEHDG